MRGHHHRLAFKGIEGLWFAKLPRDVQFEMVNDAIEQQGAFRAVRPNGKPWFSIRHHYMRGQWVLDAPGIMRAQAKTWEGLRGALHGLYAKSEEKRQAELRERQLREELAQKYKERRPLSGPSLRRRERYRQRWSHVIERVAQAYLLSQED